MRVSRITRYVPCCIAFDVGMLIGLQSAVEQAKDEQISDFIRGRYKGVAGSDMPIKDKPTTFDKSTD